MITIYSPPRLMNQFSFAKEIKKNLHESRAINVDCIEGWHIDIILGVIVNDKTESINTIVFASKKEAKLFAIYAKMKIQGMWFVDHKGKYPFEKNGMWNLLTIKRV